MELFQRLPDIFETAYQSLLGPSFLNSSHKNTSKILKRAALLDQYCTLILVHVDCVFYGLSSRVAFLVSVINLDIKGKMVWSLANYYLGHKKRNLHAQG